MKKFHRPTWPAAVLAVALSAQPPLAQAGMVAAEAAATQDQAAADRAKVRDFLERTGVMERMQAMGVDGVAAKDRVDALSREEVHALAQRIDTLPAGGLLGVTDIILILLVVILIAIIL